MSTTPYRCLICGETSHTTSKCTDLNPPSTEDFYKSSSLNSGHEDGEEEKEQEQEQEKELFYVIDNYSNTIFYTMVL
jgi:hypothetical protein